MSVTLQTGQNRLDLFVEGERFATYRYGDDLTPGFTALYASGERPVTASDAAKSLAFWTASSLGDSLFPAPSQITDEGSGAFYQIRSENLTARRGAASVGFRQECVWSEDNVPTLSEVRTVRVATGPADGRILDFTTRLHAYDASSRLQPVPCLRVASALWPAGGGQIRNSLNQYGPEEMEGRRAAWCACVGVVQGETVGAVLLDHPDNLWHPPPWIARDGVLSPSPFPWRVADFPREPFFLRYRLIVHSGYVDAGWADSRLTEFAQTPSP